MQKNSDIYKLCLFSRHSRKGASSRLRTMQYLGHLSSKGISVDVFPFFNDLYLETLYKKHHRNVFLLILLYINRVKKILSVKKYHCIWIEKELLPFLPGWIEVLFIYFNVPYVLDYDDATFHTYDNHKYALIRFLLGGKLKKIIKNASVVIVGNSYLGEYMLKNGAKKVVIIPTVVDLQRYSRSPSKSTGGIRIGWIGTPNTVKYLNDILASIQSISKLHDITLVLIGVTDININININIECHDWSENTEVSILNSIDIGIMPLPDQLWERGKCGYKLIQYMALGKPVVASPVGVNVDIVKPDVGFLATSLREWEEGLTLLCNSKELRVLFGNNARKSIRLNYTTQKTEGVLSDIFLEVLKKTAPK